MIKLVLSKPEKMDLSLGYSVKKAGKNAIVVLSSKPFYSMKEKLDSACKGKSCLFLDTISESGATDQMVYVPGENLTALSIAINQAQQSFNGKVTVVFDSITNLSIKNDVSMLIKFFSFILFRARDWGVDLVFVLPQEGVDEKLLSVLKQSADKVERR